MTLRTLILWSLLAFALAPACREAASPPAPPLPALPEPLPDLSETIQRLTRNLESQTAQQHMNVSAIDLANVLDAQLFVIYQQALLASDPSDRETLKREQEHFLAERKHALLAEYDRYKGGSMASYAASMVRISHTQKRQGRLEELVTERKARN